MASNLSLYRRPAFPAQAAPGRSLLTQNRSLESRLARMRAAGEEMSGHLLQTAEVAGAAFVAGFASGRWGGAEVLGMPVELVAGIGLNVAGHAKVAGASSQHLHNLGDGALAAYFVTLGRGVGRAVTAPVATPPPASV